MNGSLTILGIGSGSPKTVSFEALNYLEDTNIIIGYKKYIKLVQKNFKLKNKEFYSYEMGTEIIRCKKAIDLAKNNRVALLSSGDAGVFGMTGLVLELLHKEKTKINLKILPGISSINICASKLGSPLMNDFCCISLSDYLESWNDILKRLEYALKGNFVIVLLNPIARNKEKHLIEISELFKKNNKSNLPVGLITNGGREDEKVIFTTINELPFQNISMNTIIFIGNSKTYYSDFLNLIITPRGYL